MNSGICQQAAVKLALGKIYPKSTPNLKADIYTALNTLNHEIAHCASDSGGHDNKFIHANSAIGLTQLSYSNLINQKLLAGENLSTEERAYIDLRNLYNKL
jgi:hypothetical protein